MREKYVKLTLLTCSDFGSEGGGEVAVEDVVAPSDDAAPKAAAVAVPLLSTMVAITAFPRICALSPRRNRTPRYGTSNHVSCFSAVSEFQGTFSRPCSER